MVAFLGVTACLNTARSQDVHAFENDIPFGLRMAFFRGDADSTRCILTFAVENRSLLFYRRTDHFEARYEAFISMRETENRHIIRGLWRKRIEVPSYDETSLQAHYDPLQQTVSVPPGKYEGFAEIKDLHAHTYGNGRVSMNVPDLSTNLPKLSTPFFCETGQNSPGSLQSVEALDAPLNGASLQYASGEPIFLLVEVYADEANPSRNWKLTAEVVKALMVFPRVEVPLVDGKTIQRKLIQLPSQTLGLGTYEVDVHLRDENNQSLARATSFSFRIIKSSSWVQSNFMEEIRYLKYLASDSEMRQLMSTPEDQRQVVLEEFWKKLDPVPATAVNELKVQYFERIDYANTHFGTEQREGWETNMGEVYILLGPPSEIYGSRLNQIWVYEIENLVLYFFNHNLRNREEFDRYVRDRRWWRN